MQEKLERKNSAAAAAIAAASPTPPPRPAQTFDIFGDDAPAAQPATAAAPKAEPPKPTKSADSSSLLGLDFFAPTPAPRPSSVNSDPGKTANSSSRPDLNRSILSLYASAPKPQVRAQSPPVTYGVPMQTSMHQQQPSTFPALSDSFGSLSFNSAVPQAPPPKPSPFANLTAGMKKTAAVPQLSKPSSGNFFAPSQPKRAPVSASSGLGDMFVFGSPAPVQSPPAAAPYNAPAATSNHNRFGSLQFDTDAWTTPAAAPSTAANTPSAWGSAGLSSSNAWGAAPITPAPNTTHAHTSRQAATTQPAFSNGFEDDWGNFNTGTSGAPAPAPVKVTTGNPGFDDDLFGNVWK